MSKIIQPKDFTNGTFTGKFITEIVAKFLTKLFDLKKVNRIYRDNMDKVGIEFINSVISSLDIDFEIDAKEFKHIPKTGPFITVSNYPLGGIDGLLIMKMISEIRPDYKFLANHSLNQIKPINDLSIPITDARKNKKSKLSFSGIKKARQHLQTGNSLGIFPAGKASTYNRDVKIILIAGPSSSGKTTFAKRLSVQLRVNGITPHVIGMDDYFLSRDRTPIKENGEYDFESIYALDLELLNSHLKKILNGEVIKLPRYNFVDGLSESSDITIQLGKDEVLIMEGIHGLNDELTKAVPYNQKVKIYAAYS